MFGYQTTEIPVDSSKEKTHWKISNGQYDSQGSPVNHAFMFLSIEPIDICELDWKFWKLFMAWKQTLVEEKKIGQNWTKLI